MTAIWTAKDFDGMYMDAEEIAKHCLHLNSQSEGYVLYVEDMLAFNECALAQEAGMVKVFPSVSAVQDYVLAEFRPLGGHFRYIHCNLANGEMADTFTADEVYRWSQER